MIEEEKNKEFNELSQRRKNLEDDYYNLKNIEKKFLQTEDEEYKFAFNTKNIYKDVECNLFDNDINFRQDCIMDDLTSDFRDMSYKVEDDEFNGKYEFKSKIKNINDEMEDIQIKMRNLN